MANPNTIRGFNDNIALDQYLELWQPRGQPSVNIITNIWLKPIIDIDEVGFTGLVTFVTESTRLFISRWISSKEIAVGTDLIHADGALWTIRELNQLNRQGYMLINTEKSDLNPVNLNSSRSEKRAQSTS